MLRLATGDRRCPVPARARIARSPARATPVREHRVATPLRAHADPSGYWSSGPLPLSRPAELQAPRSKERTASWRRTLQSGAAGGTVVDGGQCELGLQRICRETLLLRLKLLGGDGGKVLALAICRDRKPGRQCSDPWTQRSNRGCEFFGPARPIV